MIPSLTVIIPCSGRPSILATLESIAEQNCPMRTEVVISNDGDHANVRDAYEKFRPVIDLRMQTWEFQHFDWGGHGRNKAMRLVRTSHIAYMDDDDIYTPGAFEAIYRRLLLDPFVPHMFRIKWWESGHFVWCEPGEVSRKVMSNGLLNVASLCFVHPHIKGRYAFWPGTWPGELDFMLETLTHYPQGVMKWNEDVIAHVRPGYHPPVPESPPPPPAPPK